MKFSLPDWLFPLLVIFLSCSSGLSDDEILKEYPHTEWVLAKINANATGFDPINPSNITFNVVDNDGNCRFTYHHSNYFVVDENNIPQNPWRYYTELDAGRRLPLWGPNLELDALILRKKNETFEVLVTKEVDSEEFSLPNSKVKFGENTPKKLLEFIELLTDDQKIVFKKAWDAREFLLVESLPSNLNTKNSWTENEVFYTLLPDDGSLDINLTNTGFHWVRVTPVLVLQNEQKTYVNMAIRVLELVKYQRTPTSPNQTN